MDERHAFMYENATRNFSDSIDKLVDAQGAILRGLTELTSVLADHTEAMEAHTRELRENRRADCEVASAVRDQNRFQKRRLKNDNAGG